MSRLGGPAHLVRRLVRSLRARYPSSEEQEMVGALLSSEEADTFWRQSIPDLAHAVAAARQVSVARPDRSDLVRAALLHDVGKIEARLGTLGRSIASMLQLLGLPLGRRMSAYADHAERGARILEGLGTEQTVVEFARHHRGLMPDGFDPDDWAVLSSADHAS